MKHPTVYLGHVEDWTLEKNGSFTGTCTKRSANNPSYGQIDVGDKLWFMGGKFHLRHYMPAIRIPFPGKYWVFSLGKRKK